MPDDQLTLDERLRSGITKIGSADVLVGIPSFRNAAEAALRGAKPQSENAFKIELAKRCLTHALQTAAMS